MLYEIRRYARETGLRIVSSDSPKDRTFGFETDCSEFKTEHRRWAIPISKVAATAKAFDNDLTGERVVHEAQKETLWRYLRLLRTPATRHVIAEALTTGRHPPAEPAAAA